ncbi:MAG: acyl-CoA thioesterase [Flavobacteriales bacterium]
MKLRIDWSEVDSFNHVNNVAFFKYIQAARIRLCGYAGLATSSKDRQPGFMVVSAKCDFSLPLTFPGSITIDTQVVKIGSTSVGIKHRLYDESDNLVAVGDDVIVIYDFDQMVKVTIDQKLKSTLMKLKE